MPTLNTIGKNVVRTVEAAGFVVRVRAGNPDRMVAEVYGSPRGDELSRHEYQGAVLLVFGHCLLTAACRSAEFAAALDNADLDRVADWPGSYTAVVLQQESVAAYPDLAGQFPLYYSRLNDEILIGSAPGLLASEHRRGLDLLTAAAHIACPAVLPVWSERSPYSSVHRIPGGAVLHADFIGVRISPARVPLPAQGRMLADAADMTRAALAEAVRDRCEAQAVSADFSGGLDSTAIAFLAARYSREPVTAITYHQPIAPAEDLAYALHFTELDPRIKLTVVRGSAQTLPFAGLAQALRKDERLAEILTWSPEPAPGTLAANRSTLRLAAASSSGAAVHLVGEGGDALLVAAPSYLSSLAHARSASTLFQHCGAYARLRYASPAVLAARAFKLARTSPLRALQGLATELSHPARRPANWAEAISWWPPCGEAATWLTRYARRQLADTVSDPATARAVPDGAGPADMAALADLRRSGEAQHHLRELGRSFGIAVHAPFLDTAVIRAALSVAAAYRADPWSYKPLLRAAMAGLMPSGVMGRHTKGDYSGETYCGARGAAAALRDLLHESRLAALGVLEPAPVLRVVDRMAAGVPVPLGPLQTVLATEVWLRMEDHMKAGALVPC